MNSSPIRGSPIRSRSVRRHSLGSCGLAALVALAGVTAVRAHENEAALPPPSGWRVGVALSAFYADADARWPPPYLSGVLGTGVAAEDGRGAQLDHAALSLAARPSVPIALRVAIASHPGHVVHVEAAQIIGLWETGLGSWRMTAGRGSPNAGPVIAAAGQFDFAVQQPLAKTAAFDGTWIDDGIAATWQREADYGLRLVEAGIWRGRSFPGAPDSPPMPSVRLQAAAGAIAVDVFAARLAPRGRGASARLNGGVQHTHGLLDCRGTLAQRVCFDGDVTLAAASVRAADERWTWSAAWLARLERGVLYSGSGEARYRSDLPGGWVDVQRAVGVSWLAGARYEWLVPRSTVDGIGAGLLAREAGLLDAGPAQRVTLAVLRDLGHGLRLGIEAGRHWQGEARVTHALLRVLWQSPALIGGGF